MKKIILIALLLLMSNAQAAMVLTLTPAPGTDCKALQGTWKGTFADQSGLFGNGGPWPVYLHLSYHDNHFVGVVDASNAPSYVRDKASGQVWGHCHKGAINQVFLGKPGQCGHFAPVGVMVNERVLAFHLPYENAMTGTDFLVFANKTSDNVGVKNLPKWSDAPKEVKTCH